MKHSVTVITVAILAILLGGCSIFGAPTQLDETKGWNVERLYAEAELKMNDHEYDKAISYFQTLESRYPHGRHAMQAQLEIAYAYFKKNEPVLCIAAADRFIKMHPNHPNIDYAYYLKGIATFNDRGIVEKLTRQDVSDRDPKSLRASFFALKELITRYPDSRYAKDATLRMTYLVNQLADHELHVARYYMKRQAYVAALNRAKFVIETYPDATAKEEALTIMVHAYDRLGMDDLKQSTLRVLETNFPQSSLLSQGLPPDERAWWKFWESLYNR